MKCLHCKDGRTKEGTTTIMVGQPDQKVALSVDDVPAAVCSNCGAKGSDVNLATYLLLDAFERRCDTAVVISNDSDLKEPVKIARTVLGLQLGVMNPHPARSRSRTLEATFFKQVRISALAKCQFPEVLRDAKGEFRKPAGW